MKYLTDITATYGRGLGVYASGTAFDIRGHNGLGTEVVRSDLKTTAQGSYFKLKTDKTKPMLKLTSVSGVNEAKRIFRVIITKQWLI